jgi:Outer membrane lipoprotein carrier protein LolA-like
MTSGPINSDPIQHRRRRAGWLTGPALASALLSVPLSCLAATSTLDQVMALLAQRQQGEVRYVEEDEFKMLDAPVKSAGVLIYRAPDHLEKRTLEPKAQSLTLDGERLTVQRGHRTYRVDLSAYPQMRPFIDSIRDTLAGNEAALERLFKVTFTGTLPSWRLELVPRAERVADKVSRVRIAGARDEIRSVEIEQTDGDRSVMTLLPP